MIHGGTAFAAAVQNGHLDVVKYLGERGADTGIPIHDGATPIFIACYRGNREIVECVSLSCTKQIARRLCNRGPSCVCVFANVVQVPDFKKSEARDAQ